MSDPAIPGVLFSLANKAALADRRWWDAATPIWVSAERQGLKSAAMYWPGSEVDIQGVRPTDWRVFDGNLPGDSRVDQVLDWLDRPLATRPDLITLHFNAVDRAGHRQGPQGAETNAAIASVDKSIGRLIDGLKTRGLLTKTNLLIISDHGMAPISAQRVVVMDEMVDLSSVELLGRIGPLIGFTPRAGKEAEVRQRLSTRREHVQCWPKEELPKRFDYGHNPRVPPFVCMADTEWSLATREALARNPPSGGNHGFDPVDDQMAALFIARGPAFQAGSQLQSFANLDVYPLLAHLINIKPEPHQGRLDTFMPVLVAKP